MSGGGLPPFLRGPLERLESCPPRKRFLIELALGCAALLALLAVPMRQVILNFEPFSLGVNPPPEGARSIYEMAYQVLPIFHTTASMLKGGVFPAWTPFSQAGAPLMGKMLGGILAPYHLPLYVFPLSWMPYLLTLTLVLKAVLSFVFTYVYARLLRLGPWAAGAAGALFLFTSLFKDTLFPYWGSAMWLPLLLALVELQFRGRRRTGLYLLPFAFALPFFGGHFETAFRTDLVAGIYFLVRLWRAGAFRDGTAWRRLGAVAAAAAGGALLASGQILSGGEYVSLSANKVWRAVADYGWMYRTFGKHLTAADAPALILGLGGLKLGAYLLKRFLRADDAPWGWERLRLAVGSSAALAAGLAALVNLGLDSSLRHIVVGGVEGSRQVFGAAVLLFLAFWSLGEGKQAEGRRALGVVMAGALVVLLKVPPFANILASLPLFSQFGNTTYAPGFELARAVLAAAGAEASVRLAFRPWGERRDSAMRAVLTAAVLVVAFAASRPFSAFLLKTVPGGIAVETRSGRGARGFFGPEWVNAAGDSYFFAGRAPAGRRVAAAAIALGVKNRPAALAPAAVRPHPGGDRFQATLKLPPDAGEYSAAAKVRFSDGSTRLIRGPTVQAVPRPLGWATLLILALPLLLLLPGRAGALAFVLPIVLCMRFTPLTTLPAEQFPMDLPGLRVIRSDSGLFRASALKKKFLSADYGALYGLQDIRQGDNIDHLSMVHFQRGAYTLAESDRPGALTGSATLFGVANVKYLFSPPEDIRKHPALEPVYRGKDMAVYRNKLALPRAKYFGSYRHVPIPPLGDWRVDERPLRAVAKAMRAPGFDHRGTLLVHDRPEGVEPEDAAGKQGAARITRYAPQHVRVEVDAPKPGLLYLGDAHYPGWKATVGGKRVKILRAWLAFRAVAVPAGRSVVDFRYRPWKVYGALWAALPFAWAWLLFYLRYRVRRAGRIEGSRDESEESLERTDSCAAAVEALTLFLAGSVLLYWTLWSAFSLGGGVFGGLDGGEPVLWVNLAAVSLLAGGAAFAWKVLIPVLRR